MLDGRIISGSRDHTLRVWSTGDREGEQEDEMVGQGQDQRFGQDQGSTRLRYGPGPGQGQGPGLGQGSGQGYCERVLTGHQGSVTCITPLIDPPTHVCSGSNDRTIKVGVSFIALFDCILSLFSFIAFFYCNLPEVRP